MGSDFFPHRSTSFPSLQIHSRMEERLFEAILPTFEKRALVFTQSRPICAVREGRNPGRDGIFGRDPPVAISSRVHSHRVASIT